MISKRDFSASLDVTQLPESPLGAPQRDLPVALGDGDGRRLHPMPPPGHAGGLTLG